MFLLYLSGRNTICTYVCNLRSPAALNADKCSALLLFGFEDPQLESTSIGAQVDVSQPIPDVGVVTLPLTFLMNKNTSF